MLAFVFDPYVGWRFDLACGAVMVSVFAVYVWPWLDQHMSRHADGEVIEGGLGQPLPADEREMRFEVGVPVMLGRSWYEDFPVLDQGPYGSSVGFGAAHHGRGEMKPIDWETNGWV